MPQNLVLLCPDCKNKLDIFTDPKLISYFNSDSGIVKCSICEKEFDLWDSLLDTLNEANTWIGIHYSLLGCITNTTTITIKPNITNHLDLSTEIGEGELLTISFSPEEKLGVAPFVPITTSYPKDFSN